jgi:hypothetical protein
MCFIIEVFHYKNRGEAQIIPLNRKKNSQTYTLTSKPHHTKVLYDEVSLSKSMFFDKENSLTAGSDYHRSNSTDSVAQR